MSFLHSSYYEPADVDFSPESEELDELPATADRALLDGLIDDEVYEILCEDGRQPVCPDDSEPFIPTALDLLEGRAQEVADTYSVRREEFSVLIYNAAKTGSCHRISRVDGVPSCSCKAFEFSRDRVCKHLLALCILGIDIPDPQSMEMWEPAVSMESNHDRPPVGTVSNYVEFCSAENW